MDFNNYDEMLKRAKDKIPQISQETIVFEVPKVQTTPQGNRTIIVNFSEMADKLNRPQDHLLKYLNKELATAGTLEGRRVTFIGRFNNPFLQKKIDSYTKEYVICKQCGRHDTKLAHEGRIWLVKCMACGAKEPVRGV